MVPGYWTSEGASPTAPAPSLLEGALAPAPEPQACLRVLAVARSRKRCGLRRYEYTSVCAGQGHGDQHEGTSKEVREQGSEECEGRGMLSMMPQIGKSHNVRHEAVVSVRVSHE